MSDRLSRKRVVFIHALLVIFAMFVWVGAPTSAFAQQQQQPTLTSFQVEHFEPLPSQGYNLLNISKSDVLPHLRFSAGLFFHYANDPIQVVPLITDDVDDGGERLIQHQLKTEVLGSIGLFNIVELGFALPVIPFQSGGDLGALGAPGQSVDGAAIGDLRIIPKVQILNPNKFAGFGVAFLLPLYAPIGDTDSFQSDGAFRLEPRLNVDWRHEVGLAISANLAYQLLRPTTTAANYVSDDMFRWGVGLELPSGVDIMRVIGAIYGNISIADAEAVTSTGDPAQFDKGKPVEAEGGLQFFLPADLVVNAGAGAGLTSGVGAPDFRVFASLSYTPREFDRDGDGILDKEDACPNDAEDFDKYEDQDGCPEYDNDSDGLIDPDDRCPNEPEDIDKFEDEDGCPDPDNDRDRILDKEDECPDEAEDIDNFEDENGCPDLDNDSDTIPDAEDQCPLEPEDLDGFQDKDGCPDPDNDRDTVLDVNDECPDEAGVPEEKGCPIKDRDKDTIPDKVDKCPDKPETFNGVKDDDGCPDGKETVVVTETEIKIFQKVFFDTGRATIKKKSYPLLNTVALVLIRNPQITKARVEGHTDDVGDEYDNLELSRRRAEAVRAYLIDQGVPPSRLAFEGYGEDRPLCKDMPELLENKRRNARKIKSCRSDNRRVEFRITEVNGNPIEADDSVLIKKRKNSGEIRLD
jgi:outer membrane protein OmpA-like peptidoglycan-associated protein